MLRPRRNPNSAAFFQASTNGNISDVKRLLEETKLPLDDLDYALIIAAEKGHIEIVKSLLENKANPATNSNDPIKQAARNGHVGIVKLLAGDKRANPIAAIELALLYEHADILKLLLADERVYASIYTSVSCEKEISLAKIALKKRYIDIKDLPLAIAYQVNPESPHNQEKRAVKRDAAEKNLSSFDEKEKMGRAILPIQRFFHSQTRKDIHKSNYPAASYMTDIYLPRFLEKDTFVKVLNCFDKINFISTLSHITNYKFFDYLLDTGVFSRKLLDSYNMNYLPSALNITSEKADFDTVCFAIDDVDSLALKSSCQVGCPVKIQIDYKKVIQSNRSNAGYIFVKEHDLMWTTKFDGKDMDPNLANKDHSRFATGDIPDEYSEIIRLGNINLKLYRNACGVKFVVEDKKYILHYLYNEGPYIGLPSPDKEFYHVAEEAIETDFGKTLFYGFPENTEKFFVMQFFRHVEKLPKLMTLIYNELHKLTEEELITFLNQVGKKLSAGSEFNFHRAFQIPLGSLTQIEILTKFNFSKSEFNNKSFLRANPGCNRFFTSWGPVKIKMDDIVECVKANNLDTLTKLMTNNQKIFESARFKRYLLSHAQEGTEVYDKLFKSLNKTLSDSVRTTFMSGRPLF